MIRCPACQSLEGQSADIDPHEQMRGDAHNLRADGVVEVYSCRPCGTRWERFVANKAFGASSGSWKTLKAARGS
jgi:hypothetical protein